MNDHLSEFEDIRYRRSLPVKLVIALFASSIVAIYLFLIWPKDEDLSLARFTSIDSYITLAFAIIPYSFLYLFIKNKRAGWLLVAIFTMLLIAINGIWLNQFIIVEKEVRYPGFVAINGFVFAGSVVSMVLLHLNTTRREFNVDTTILTLSSFVNGLLLLILLYAL